MLTTLVITGDFNVHIDNINGKNIIELSAILDMFDLMWNSWPIIEDTYTVDLGITKGVNMSTVTVFNVALSDNLCVLFDLSITINIRSEMFFKLH